MLAKDKMDAEQTRALVRQTFDAVAAGYDGQALRFFPTSAEHLASRLDLRGDEHILDVATGTGHAALSLAGRLPEGKVTGVDFSLECWNKRGGRRRRSIFGTLSS